MKKIATYRTLGTNNLESAKSFYDGLFEDIETMSFSPNDRSWFWVIKGDDSMLLFSSHMMEKKPLQAMAA